MHRTVRAVLAAAGVLLLSGSALSQDIRIPRKGSSPGSHPPPAADASPRWWEEDWATQCQRRTARLSRDVETQNLVVSYLIGGVLGALIASSTSDEVRKHAGDAASGREYAECMARRRPGGRGDGD